MKVFRRVLTIVLLATVLVGALSWYRVAAEPIDGKLDINIIGGNWVHTDTGPYLVNGVYNSGARWSFVTVVWYTLEPNPPSAPCPSLDGTSDGTYFYYSHGPSGQCHAYQLGGDGLNNLDQLIPLPGNPGGLRGNGNYIAMGMWAPPTWASGAPRACPANYGDCAIVLRDHLITFMTGAQDLARFLVERYAPAAFSVWNEPNGYAYLSIQPDTSR